MEINFGQARFSEQRSEQEQAAAKGEKLGSWDAEEEGGRMPEVCKLFPFAGLPEGLEDVSRVAEAAPKKMVRGAGCAYNAAVPRKERRRSSTG
jgi:hypothetical protein